MRLITTTAFVCSAIAQATYAICPTEADLNTGIRHCFDSGYCDVPKRIGPNEVETLSFDDNAQIYERRIAIGAIFETKYDQYKDGKPLTEWDFAYTYSFNPEDHLPPDHATPFGARQYEETTDETYTNWFRVTVSDPVQFTFGNCTYDAIRTRHGYALFWDDDHDTGLYLPQLGIYIGIDDTIPWNRDLLRKSTLSVSD